MNYKEILNFILSFLLIFNNFLFAFDGHYDETNATLPENPNVECYFVFDKLASNKCLELYNKYGGKINEMLNDSDTFYKCLISNCGLYKTNAVNYEQSYQYNMEVVKKCQLDNEATLNFNELRSSDWFVNLNLNLTGSAKVSKTETQERFIPFKVLKYKCPKFVEVTYGEEERDTQYPVLCFTSQNITVNNLIIKCLEQKDSDACNQLQSLGIAENMKDYVKYIYCDKDNDGDGFPESLSSALQKTCNRPDAASLRCTKNSLCSTNVRCIQKDNKNVDVYNYNSCKDLTRNYKDYTINTQCGDVEDIYQTNPNCIRINSVTDAREEGIEYENGNMNTNNLNKPLRYVEVKNYPNTNDEMSSYHEYVLYQKKDTDISKRFVALVYPKALYKVKKVYSLIGKILNLMFGGAISVIEGDAPFIGPEAIGAGFVSHDKSIPNTVVDSVLRNAIKAGYYITTNKDVKGITYKMKKKHSGFGLVKKYKMWFMKAWWDPTIVEKTNLAGNPKPEDWIWNGYKRKNIHYYFKIKVNPSDILVEYNINANNNYFSSPEVYYKQYGNGLTCSSDSTNTLANWVKMNNSSKYAIKSPSIQNMTIFLTYPSLYLFKFYNGNQFIGSFFKNFTFNNGQYPLKDLKTDGTINGNFGSTMNRLYSNYRNLVINETVNEYMGLSETKALINNITNSLLNTFINRNIDEIYKKEKKFTKYTTEIKDFYDFFALNYALNYFTNNSLKDNICEIRYTDSVSRANDNNGANSNDENNISNFNQDLKDYKECLLNNASTKDDIENKLNNNTSINDLDSKRLRKLMELTRKVYSDLTVLEKSNINYYLNKSGTRYNLSNDAGRWSMSFKSSCGDYAEAKLNAEANYNNRFNDITNNHFSTEATGIRNGLISLIDSHMKNITLRYKYKKYKRTGTSKWDKWHSTISGRYSCTYNSTCWNGCATTKKCNCTINKDNKTVCETCCVGGYVPCTKTESGSCNTYGTTGNNCTGKCSGYVNGHYGSQVNACGDSECDVSNDWDDKCSANYYYYKTNDNGGTGSKQVTDQSSGRYFDSYGNYRCNRKSLSPTGNPTKYCKTSGHDLRDFNYRNTLVSSSLTWTSTAKKLNISTTSIKDLEDGWLRSHHYKDYSYVSNTLWAADAKGYNSVRVSLSTSKTNGIFTETNQYIKPIIKEYVTNFVKQFYLKKIAYEFDNHVKDDSILNRINDVRLKALFNDGLSASGNSGFKPFNKIKIYDLLADKDSPYAINYTIETPSGILIKNPEALNIVMLSFPEVRKYRCYTDFKSCIYSHSDGCTLDNTLDYNYVTDFTGKKIPTVREETYKCKKTTSISICKKYQVDKKCYNINIGNPSVEFDDEDFTKDFGKATGEQLAFNNALTIFNGQELKCEYGLFTDFSWLTDPMFLMQMAMVAGGYLMENTSAGQALAKWLEGSPTASDPCANSWLSCMASHGSTVGTSIQTGTSAATTCDSNTKSVDGCQSFSGVTPLSNQMNTMMGNQFDTELGDPTTALAVQIAYNLAFNTFDKCNQCINKKCAKSHNPKAAMILYKMTNGLKTDVITGAEYGLGPAFKAYNQCFYKDTKCARKFWGKCLRREKEYCCYNTKMARILAGQIYEQLGLNYQDDGCRAIKITDLQKIDFSPCPDGTIPSPSNRCINYKELNDYINSKINWNVKGSFDMNKLIQAIMDEGK